MEFFRAPLVKFLAAHLAVGIGAGWIVLGLLLWIDVAGLRSLIVNSGDSVIALVMLAIFFALTFGSLAMGTGIMGLSRSPPAEDKPRDEPPRGKLQPVAVTAKSRAKHGGG
ncbi:MAG: hypothetical protein ACKVOI_16570 [Dongiaceae bacterium]